MKVIQLEGVEKKFILSHQKDTTLNSFLPQFSKQRSTEDFSALKDINMEIEQGRVVGIIGRNGSGKTTLLNIISGICTPTNGNVKVNGKISTLVSLGAGFKSELSGNENIYLNGLILGMTKGEIKRRYQGIVDFSELDGFLDVPIQTYSQGMLARLGFSVAIHVDFDVLLMDEVISVGDAWFQKKCFAKVVDFRREGKTMVIVTHSTDLAERICDEVFLLENGRIVSSGEPQRVVSFYSKLLNEKRPLKNIQ